MFIGIFAQFKQKKCYRLKDVYRYDASPACAGTAYSGDRFLATGRVQWPAKTGRRKVVFSRGLRVQKKKR